MKAILTRLFWTPLGYAGRALEHALDALIARSNRYERRDEDV